MTVPAARHLTFQSSSAPMGRVPMIPCVSKAAISCCESPKKVAEHIAVMFAQARRGGGGTPGALGESPGGRDLRVRSRLRMVDHIPEAPGRQMRIDEGFAAFEHSPGGDAVRLQEMHGLIVLALLRPGRQDLVEFGLMVSTCEYGRKSRHPAPGLADRWPGTARATRRRSRRRWRPTYHRPGRDRRPAAPCAGVGCPADRARGPSPSSPPHIPPA